MIFGRRFQLQTDHRPLFRIFGTKKGVPIHTANRLQRFVLTL
uniref:Reverse transcriptase RNase H-like domain-containing protein n=1 Tax=Anopheles dirus TaxID=7168 RepID=A0A182NY41_9DIPT